MILRLLRHAFADRPDWIVVNESVPLGTKYQLLSPFGRRGTLVNTDTKEEREVLTVWVKRVDESRHEPRLSRRARGLEGACASARRAAALSGARDRAVLVPAGGADERPARRREAR